jgi:hypothetical protein
MGFRAGGTDLSLAGLTESVVRSFDEFEAVRAELRGRADAIELLWKQARAFASESKELLLSDAVQDRHDVVEDALAQMRRRLDASVIEVGVFGDVNRGKSTLLNALLGEVVSSMRVTPETAVPVHVERGDGTAMVLFSDGREERIEDPADARERMTQRWRRRKNTRDIARVIQYVDVPWLRDGIRLVDTPGLNDPSLQEAYQDYTLAELDRVAAAIFVFMSPPGIASDEVRLLQSLNERGLEKAFLVCNFHGEQWDDSQARDEVVEHIRSVVASEEEFLGERAKIFALNAKRGLTAATTGDEQAFIESGVQHLRTELEAYLSGGVLNRMRLRCDALLGRARDAASAVLMQRLDALSDRDALEAAVRQHRAALSASRRTLDDIVEDCRATTARLQTQMISQLDDPFDRAVADVDRVSSLDELAELSKKYRLEAETAASGVSALYAREVVVLEERLRRRLFETYGVDERVAGLRPQGDLRLSELELTVDAGEPDADVVNLSAGATATAGALVGGSLAGGAGIALLAMGPVGWLIGAGVGALAGWALGGSVAETVTRGKLDSKHRLKLSNDIRQQQQSARRQAERTCAQLSDGLIAALTAQQDSFFGDQRRDLERVQQIVSDDRGRARAIDEAQRLISELRDA